MSLQDADKYCGFLGRDTLEVGMLVPAVYRHVPASIFRIVHCTRRHIQEHCSLNHYSYNKTNWMHKFLKFIFGIKLYMFRTVPLFGTCRDLFQK